MVSRLNSINKYGNVIDEGVNPNTSDWHILAAMTIALNRLTSAAKQNRGICYKIYRTLK